MASAASGTTESGREAVAALLEQLRAEAATALATCERWFDGDADAGRTLQSLLTQLDQVARLSGLDGIGALADECRLVATGLDVDDARRRQALAEGLVALGGRLRALRAGEAAPVEAFVADLNALREARGERPYPEAELFAQRLAARAPFPVPHAASATTAPQQAVASKVLEPSRKVFAALRRAGDPKPALEAVRKLATALERAADGPDEAMPWWIARLLADALHAGRLAYDDALAAHLAGLAPLVEAIAAGRDATGDGAAWTYRALHPLASLGRADDELARVFEVFGLADDEAAADAPSGAAADARLAVAEAAREELARVRDAFDVFLRSGAHDTDLLKPAVARLDAIVAPLRVAGIVDAADLLADGRTALAALVDGQPLGNAANAIADRLLQAENLLSAGADGPGDRMRVDALRAIVDAAHDELGGVRQALFEASEVDDAEALARVPAALTRLAGALAIAGLDEAAALAADIGAAAPAIGDDGQSHELLAEAMVCLELYLGAQREQGAPAELLARARDVLTRAAPAGAVKAAAADAEPPVVAGEPDPDLLEIYLEEARECVAAARDRLATWRASPDDAEARTDLQRAFHTLKGSGRMVGALRTAEFARSFEELLERIGSAPVAASPSVIELVGAALAVLPALLEQIESGQDPAVPLRPLQAAAAQSDLSKVPGGLGAQVLSASIARDAATVGRWLDAAAAGSASGAVPAAVVDALRAIEVAAATVGEAAVAGDAQALRARIEGAAGVDDALRREANAVLDAWRQSAPADSPTGDGIDAGTAAAYRDEAHALLDRMGDACDALLLDAADADAVLAMQRVLHTLKGASRAAGYRALSDVAHALEDVLRAVAQERMLVTPRLLWTLQRVFDAMYGMLEVETADRAADRAARVMDELKQLSDDDRSPPPLSSGADRRRKPRVAAESERVRSDQFDRALVRALSLGLRSTELDRRMREQTMWDIATIGDELAALAADAAAIRDLLVRARVAPLHTHASRWRRTVRQAAEDTGKEVELRFEGSDNELDRRLLDALVMPIEHLLRNAVAHGIETTFARRAAGKPAGGVIVIRAAVEPAGLRIEVEDDGAGVDVEKVRRTARERGIVIGDGEVAPAKLLALLATPGFSTSAAVTHTAGYGIGMDTVAAALRELGGELELATTPGHGTRFVMHLPHASPVVAVELVRSGSALVALPPEAVVATRAAAPGASAVEHDDESWPVLDLVDCIGLDGARPGADAAIAVLLRSEGRGVAVVVDEHLGRVETAMHRLRPGDLREGVCVAGVGLLDGGRLATVLNAKAAIRGTKTALAIKPLAFVADDSNTARDETVRKLERAGWRVRTVGDGTAAKDTLAGLTPDLVVLDIDMPGHDGLAVLEWMRGRVEHERTPVVLASARLDDARRERAGALDAVCVAKPFSGVEFEDAVAALTSRA